MTLCSRRVYLLKLLRSQGLTVQQLHGICGLWYCPVGLLFTHITYLRLDAFLNGLESLFFCDENYPTAELLDWHRYRGPVM